MNWYYTFCEYMGAKNKIWSIKNNLNPKCEKQAASNVFNFSHDWAPLFFKI